MIESPGAAKQEAMREPLSTTQRGYTSRLLKKREVKGEEIEDAFSGQFKYILLAPV